MVEPTNGFDKALADHRFYIGPQTTQVIWIVEYDEGLVQRLRTFAAGTRKFYSAAGSGFQAEIIAILPSSDHVMAHQAIQEQEDALPYVHIRMIDPEMVPEHWIDRNAESLYGLWKIQKAVCGLTEPRPTIEVQSEHMRAFGGNSPSLDDEPQHHHKHRQDDDND